MLLDMQEVARDAQPASDLAGPCIYFLLQGEEVVYVGQSTSVYARLQIHRANPGKEWDRFYILPTTMEEIDELELRYYQALRPKYNKAVPTPPQRSRCPRQDRDSVIPILPDRSAEVSRRLDELLGPKVPSRRKRVR